MIKPDDLKVSVGTVLARAPDWLRRDLASSELASRARAEEVLAAVIQAALQENAY